MKVSSIKFLIVYFLFIFSNFHNYACFNIRNKNKVVPIKISMEYPYTCGTWFNRGKNTCNEIIKTLDKGGFSVDANIKAYHQGEFPPEYNGEFNIYFSNISLNTKELIATSDQKSKLYHPGLKYFAYTFYQYEKGEKNYLESFPQKENLLKYILTRFITVTNNMKIN
jgi:hypothetical protein